MHDIKVGDKVKVVRGSNEFISLGSVHTVYDVFVSEGHTYVSVSEDEKDTRSGWDIDRFVKYEEKENTLKESDAVTNAKKVEMGKKYRRVGTHEPVRVICTDRIDPEITCIALFKTEFGESILFLDAYGRGYGKEGQIIEEVPAVDWSKVEVDAPIWIKQCPGLSYDKRHFYRFDGTYVYFYPDGTTSFTCSEMRPWYSVKKEYCFLEEPK